MESKVDTTRFDSKASHALGHPVRDDDAELAVVGVDVEARLLAPLKVGGGLDLLADNVIVEDVALVDVERHQSFKLETLEVLEITSVGRYLLGSDSDSL